MVFYVISPNGSQLNTFQERREDYIKICVPLYNASINGDWETAKIIIDHHPEVVRCSISENCDTALHIAASTKTTYLVERFVENLVMLMTREDLELQNKSGNTALCLAAITGNVKSAVAMVNKNVQLVDIARSGRMLPLYLASLFGQSEMVHYLYNVRGMTSEAWTDQYRGWVLEKCLDANIFDAALKIVEDWPQLVNNVNLLRVLARKTDACRGIKPHFIWRVIRQSESRYSIISVCRLIVCADVGTAEKPSDALKLLRIIWKSIVTLPKAEFDKVVRGSGTSDNDPTKYLSKLLFLAVEKGNTEFVVEIICQYPDLIWKTDDNNQSIFHAAVLHRQVGIYSLVYEIGSVKEMMVGLKDKRNNNNMWHLAAMRAERTRLEDVSGVALQMQRELLWFKEVEAMMPLIFREKKNMDGLLPGELFTLEHADLLSASEKWMKDTASQSMVVSALIATIAFAASFTIPGGYDQNNGIPIFLHEQSLIIFVISDALSLTFSTISILIFLSILTSRYAEHDFLESLPKRLMRGLATLFLSVITMMVTFSVSFFLLFHDKLIWVPIVISMLASTPVLIYARLQYSLLVDVYHSTYGSKNLFRPKKLKLYYQNPKY